MQAAGGGIFASPAKTSVFNSSFGRFLVFLLSVSLYACSCFGVMYSRMPEYVHSGMSTVFTLLTFCAMVMYFMLPARFAEQVGMNPKYTWKPYLCLWHLSFYLAPVAIIFLAHGGAKLSAFGQFYRFENVTEAITWPEGHPFTSFNGFVALNLTKAFVQTLMVDPMDNETTIVKKNYNLTGDDGDVMERITVNQATRFREVKYFPPSNPVVEGFMRPLPVDTMLHYIVAPIFSNFTNCLARFRATSVCQARNKIVGWAVATRNSTCSAIGFVNCLEHELKIEPMYGCVLDNLKNPSKLCGRVVSRPNPTLVDQIVDTHVEEGWRFYGGTPEEVKAGSRYDKDLDEDVPTALFVNANYDECIVSHEKCEATWKENYLIGGLLSLLTMLLIFTTAIIDCWVDNNLRIARMYMHAA